MPNSQRDFWGPDPTGDRMQQPSPRPKSEANRASSLEELMQCAESALHVTPQLRPRPFMEQGRGNGKRWLQPTQPSGKASVHTACLGGTKTLPPQCPLLTASPNQPPALAQFWHLRLPGGTPAAPAEGQNELWLLQGLTQAPGPTSREDAGTDRGFASFSRGNSRLSPPGVTLGRVHQLSLRTHCGGTSRATAVPARRRFCPKPLPRTPASSSRSLPSSSPRLRDTTPVRRRSALASLFCFSSSFPIPPSRPSTALHCLQCQDLTLAWFHKKMREKQLPGAGGTSVPARSRGTASPPRGDTAQYELAPS